MLAVPLVTHLDTTVALGLRKPGPPTSLQKSLTWMVHRPRTWVKLFSSPGRTSSEHSSQ